jgi:hypothetical protein
MKKINREGIWLRDFIYLCEIEQRNLCNCFKCGREEVKGERGDGGDLTYVQYKPNQNCHYESPHIMPVS